MQHTRNTHAPRLAAEIVRVVQSLEAAGRPVSKLSFIGYSLGGLIARFTAGEIMEAFERQHKS